MCHIVGALLLLKLRVLFDRYESLSLYPAVSPVRVIYQSSRCPDPVPERREPHLTVADQQPLSPEERSRLLSIGRELNHHVKDLISVVQFRTYQRWVKHQLEGRKAGRVGRPRTISQDLREAIIRFAKENVGWGYLRIVGELLKLHRKVGKTSIRRILREEGIYPELGKPYSKEGVSPWEHFLKLHINTLVACDFFCKTQSGHW